MSCGWECVSEALAEMMEIFNQRSRPVFAVRFRILPLPDRERVHDVLDGVSWRGELVVGAEIEAEEGGLEFATGLDSRFLDPLVWGPSIAAVPSERIKIPEVYGSPGIRGGNHSAAVCPGDQVHGVLCQG